MIERRIMKEYLFGLQIFANPNTNVTTDVGLTAEMKTYYDRNLIRSAEPNLVHDQFGMKRPIPANNGKIIEFRKFKSLPKALVPLTEGVTPDGKKLTVETITSQVSQYGDYITQSDVLELTALDNTILEATKLLGNQAGVTLDTVVRNVLHSGTGIQYAEKWSGTTPTEVTTREGLDITSKITVELIERCVAKLRSRNVPTINGAYVGIVHPHIAYEIMRDPEWRKPHDYCDPENLYKGEIGMWGGVRFVQSSEAKIYRGGDLSAASRTLTVASFNTSTKVVGIDETLTTADQAALVGREVIIDGIHYDITAVPSASSFTVKAAPASNYPADGDKVFPGEGTIQTDSGVTTDIAVYGVLLLGADAYGVTEIEGGGLETIVKQKGSAGTSDPLNQRSSVGWKAIKTAEILQDEYIIRILCTSEKFSRSAKGN